MAAVARAQRSQFGLQIRQDLRPVPALALGLARVEAHRVAPPPLALADHNLLDMQVLRHFAVAPPAPDDFVRLPAAMNRHAYDVASAAARQGFQVLRRHHPGVAHEHAAERPPGGGRSTPAIQVPLDLGLSIGIEY